MKPLLSGTAAAIVGAIGTVVMGAAAFVPAPWNLVAGIVGFLACSLAGLAVASPKITEGKPILQGTAWALASGALGLLATAFPAIPTGWPQSIALAVAGLLAVLTGQALPALGSPSHEKLEAAVKAGAEAEAKVTGKAEALTVFREQ